MKFRVGDIVELIENVPNAEHGDSDGYDVYEGTTAKVLNEPHWSSRDWLVVQVLKEVNGDDNEFDVNERFTLGIHENDFRWKVIKRASDKLEKIKKKIMGE